MSYLDKTFCASPKCKNDCGRMMTDQQRKGLDYHNEKYVSYGYFCGEPQFAVSRVGDPNSFDLPNDVTVIDLTPPLPDYVKIIDGVQELSE